VKLGGTSAGIQGNSVFLSLRHSVLDLGMKAVFEVAVPRLAPIEGSYAPTVPLAFRFLDTHPTPPLDPLFGEESGRFALGLNVFSEILGESRVFHVPMGFYTNDAWIFEALQGDRLRVELALLGAPAKRTRRGAVYLDVHAFVSAPEPGTGLLLGLGLCLFASRLRRRSPPSKAR
jgi:hypothetical protein